MSDDRIDSQGARIDTRESLLRAAEQLFADKGIAQASLRTITQKAGANLAAVHYHFGSKEGLVREVFARRLRPLNRERLQLLESCEHGSGATPSLESVLYAFVSPALRTIQDEAAGGQSFSRLMGRAFTEPDSEVRGMILDEFREVVGRFSSALSRALPHLGGEELFWRFHYMVGAMVYAASLGSMAAQMSSGTCDPGDVESNVRRLVSFLAAGMRSPAADPLKAGRK